MSNRPILLVEDNPDDVELTRIAFAEAKIANPLHVVGNGAEALDYLFGRGEWADRERHEPPSLVLLDLNLPDMSGIDILTRIKGDATLRRTPVVILTTTDDQSEIERCYDLGANVYVTKPVNYESFADAIRQLGLFLSVIQVPEIGAA